MTLSMFWSERSRLLRGTIILGILLLVPGSMVMGDVWGGWTWAIGMGLKALAAGVFCGGIALALAAVASRAAARMAAAAQVGRGLERASAFAVFMMLAAVLILATREYSTIVLFWLLASIIWLIGGVTQLFR